MTSARCGEASTLLCRRLQHQHIFNKSTSFVLLRHIGYYSSRWHLLQSSPLLRWYSSACPVRRSKFLSASAILSLSHPSLRWASEHGTWTSQMLQRQSLSRFRLAIDTWTAQQSTAMRKRLAKASRMAWRQLNWIDPVSGLHQSSGMISTLPFSYCLPSHCITKLTRCTVSAIRPTRSSKLSIRR